MSEAAKVDQMKHMANRKNIEIQTLKIELEGALGSLLAAQKEIDKQRKVLDDVAEARKAQKVWEKRVDITFKMNEIEIADLKTDLAGANEHLIKANKLLEDEKHARNALFAELQGFKELVAHYKTFCSQKNFPIQPTHGSRVKEEGTVIPYWLAEEAYKYYSHRFGTCQTLERLMQRGGFGRKELLMFLRKKIE